VKLSLMTYGLPHDLGLDEMLRILSENDYAGVEFRVDMEQKHGVEPDLSATEREAVRARCAEAGVAIVSIASGNRFHQQDRAEVRENVERAKQVVRLAADLGAPLVRVFGNNFPEGVDREAVMQQVAGCLRELGDDAGPLGVDVDLEMHGEFCWREAFHTAELADHPRVGLIFNSDPRDVENGSIAHVFHAAGDRIRHVHMHHLTAAAFPYHELMQILVGRGYEGYLSAEITAPGSDPERLLGYYSRLFHATVALAKDHG